MDSFFFMDFIQTQYNAHKIPIQTIAAGTIFVQMYTVYKNHSIKRKLAQITRTDSIKTSGKIGFHGDCRNPPAETDFLCDTYEKNINIIPAKNCSYFGSYFNYCVFAFGFDCIKLLKLKEDALLNIKKRTVKHPARSIKLYGISAGVSVLYKLLPWMSGHIPEIRVDEVHMIVGGVLEEIFNNFPITPGIKSFFIIQIVFFILLLQRFCGASVKTHKFFKRNDSKMIQNCLKELSNRTLLDVIQKCCTGSFHTMMAIIFRSLSKIYAYLMIPCRYMLDILHITRFSDPRGMYKHTKFYITNSKGDWRVPQATTDSLIAHLKKSGFKNIYTKTINTPQYNSDGTEIEMHCCYEPFKEWEYTQVS